MPESPAWPEGAQRSGREGKRAGRSRIVEGSEPACWQQRTKVVAETLEDVRVHGGAGGETPGGGFLLLSLPRRCQWAG